MNANSVTWDTHVKSISVCGPLKVLLKGRVDVNVQIFRFGKLSIHILQGLIQFDF